MCKCSICSKKRQVTYPVTLNNGFSGEVCPYCLLKNLKKKLLWAAIISIFIVVVLIIKESRGISDSLIVIGILAAVLLTIYAIFMVTANDAKKERLFQLGEIEKRGWPITIGYQQMAYWVMDNYADKKGLIKASPNVNNNSTTLPQTPSSVAAQESYRKLADQLAHYQSFSMEQSEADAMEEKLLSGGGEALTTIVAYLLDCGSGAQSEYWWANAGRLVKLIRRFPDADHKALLQILFNRTSNIWEYQTQIKDVAEQELLALEKASAKRSSNGAISAENAHGELKIMENINSPENRLKRLYEVRDSVNNWSDADKSYYYFIAGGAARVLYPQSEVKFAFYAAQVFFNPNPSGIGWIHLFEIDSMKGMAASPENARILHDKYPLPATFEEVANYTTGNS